MPLYVYRCDACGREVEELQKMGADDPPSIESCPSGGPCAMSKAITSAGFKFVGEGWGGWRETGPGIIQRNTPGKKASLAPKKKRVADDAV